MMTDDIFRTVRELLESSDELLLGNAVNTEGRLYDDSVENLTAILAMQGHYARMYAALERLVYDYEHFAKTNDGFVAEVSRLLQEIDNA
jgi:hypothetical protein